MAGSEDFDVVVVGGGAGGVAAAVGAADAGASVCLVEQYGFLGGAATNSSVLAYCGFFDQQQKLVVDGVGGDILRRLKERGVYQEQRMGWTGNRIVLLDTESTKLVLDQAVADAGVHALLHARLTRAAVSASQVRSVEINHRGGNQLITAGAFIDASGDGVLASLAGAALHEIPVSERQTNTLACVFGGVSTDADLSKDALGVAIDRFNAESGTALVRRGGIVVRLPVSGGVMALLVDEHFDTLDVDAFSAAEASARSQAWAYLEALRKYMHGWENAYLIQTGPQIGIRESRRLLGRTSITAEDVLMARKRPHESIARCGWPIEDHAGPGVTNYTPIDDGQWYDVPYDAIRSLNVDNLWGVGRVVSATGSAFASVRVMGTAFATGHAAGVAAAQYVHGNAHDIAAIRSELLRQGALI